MDEFFSLLQCGAWLLVRRRTQEVNVLDRPGPGRNLGNPSVIDDGVGNMI
jgi:hypothetical protein